VGIGAIKTLVESFLVGGCAQLTSLNLNGKKFVIITFSLLTTSQICFVNREQRSGSLQRIVFQSPFCVSESSTCSK
jgi:hypothetical protein